VAALERTIGVITLAEDVEQRGQLDRQQAEDLINIFGPEASTRAAVNKLTRDVNALTAALHPPQGVVAAANALVVEGRYNLVAQDTSITSRHSQGRTSLTIEARGNTSGVTPADGLLDLKASGTAMLSGALHATGHRSRVLLQPVAAPGPDHYGVNIDGQDGIRIRRGTPPALAPALVAPPPDLPHIDLQGQKITIHSGGADVHTGPRIILNSAAAGGDHPGPTLTLATGGAAGPRIVLGPNGIEIIADANVKIELGAVAGNNAKITNTGTSLTVRSANVVVE
jgi:hypothetical protein